MHLNTSTASFAELTLYEPTDKKKSFYRQHSNRQHSRTCITLVSERLTVELILHDVVKDFQKKEDEMMIGRVGVKEPRRGEGLEKVKEFRRGHHRERLDVR